MNPIYFIKRFISTPAIEKKLLIKGILISAMIKLMVQLLPLKYYMFLLKTKPKFLALESDKESAIPLARKTMRRIKRFAPWNCSCLVKSITLKLLLNSIGIESKVALGVAKIQSKILFAHASIKIDDRFEYLKKKKYLEVFSID